MPTCCPIVELRQYTLHPGKRETLIELFEREFIETQEAFGMRVIGQFRDLDDPNRFVWLRGFANMEARGGALAGFYGGPVWKAHRDAANATMFDSDNVLLLHPIGSGFALGERSTDTVSPKPRVIIATIHYLDADVLGAFARFFAATMKPAIIAAGSEILAAFETESSPNSFPPLPVREGEYVFVYVQAFADLIACEHYRTALRESGDWRGTTSAPLLRQFMRKPETLTLMPTPRSLLR